MLKATWGSIKKPTPEIVSIGGFRYAFLWKEFGEIPKSRHR